MRNANCIYVSEAEKIRKTQCEQLLEVWAKLANISKEYCTINLVENMIQVGTAYKVMVKLFLPSLWGNKSIQNHLEVKPSDVFIMT
ncbi:hypothetical protein SD70_04360 [Gordoniibacillus kamchatkensis]|uniref:Uncharacterized protein n=1 Tax=Gordoniibacillus kamchatkensis TaxID=1590651 RepID=A0ABR5ALE8_9BACL|nr:hypothetical protein [Paenibacillus sp. VKM B-2647]KIL41854.1 hypothetical protein SD70_04360 [Paenibacillus sp. VKM B-2647]